MEKGIYKGKEVNVYDAGNEFIIEFKNGSTITMKDVSEIQFNHEKHTQN